MRPYLAVWIEWREESASERFFVVYGVSCEDAVATATRVLEAWRLVAPGSSAWLKEVRQV